MTTMTSRRTAEQNGTFERRLRRFDHIFCLTIAVAASMPAIVVMLILAWPIAPMLAACLVLAATGRGGTAEETTRAAEPVEEDIHHIPHHHAPRYA